MDEIKYDEFNNATGTEDERRYKRLLLSTGRNGMANLISRMERDGFFTSPCSTRFHLSEEGGLLKHSLNVYDIAMSLNKALNGGFSADTIIICALLHDLGKMGDFGKPLYIPTPPLKNGGTPATPYKQNDDLVKIPHEVMSVEIASHYIDLTEDETYAILMHNGLYSCFYREIQNHETPLYLILHSADMWASRVTEIKL